ncbi:hypothetical protein OIU85_021022 [Salix viminalis]|uniref:Uncharacterized protein n=1 Tax=Salix viminalis TaxID=40686 RepID=A0A9Q0UHH8_SALVM|nr:hypothetical protein OIU85_021022 [Salix viminalis]
MASDTNNDAVTRDEVAVAGDDDEVTPVETDADAAVTGDEDVVTATEAEEAAEAEDIMDTAVPKLSHLEFSQPSSDTTLLHLMNKNSSLLKGVHGPITHKLMDLKDSILGVGMALHGRDGVSSHAEAEDFGLVDVFTSF